MRPEAKQKIALVIGAGPAGLAAAYELLSRTEYLPLIIEADSQVGGLSKTVNYKGNRIDIGGHRFFTKSTRVEKWWMQFLKISDDEMRTRSRLSRILFLGKLFAYPVELTLETLKNLGWLRSARIVKSYLSEKSRAARKILTLEDFFISRFGRVLYELFFESYTEKVWGVPCREIKPDWGAQRVKGLSMVSTLLDALTKKLRIKGLRGKKVETSLIERFLYPKFGPGQLWDAVSEQILKRGGQSRLNSNLVGLDLSADQKLISEVTVESKGLREKITVDLVVSTMPLQSLILSFTSPLPIPAEVKAVATGLCYRDFITVGLLSQKTKTAKRGLSELKDNWLYVQEPEVKVGRIQLFHNWSSDLVAKPDTIWFGMEYFCQEGDTFWKLSDAALVQFALTEAEKLNLVSKEHFLDATVVRAPKAYPAYFGSYEQLPVLQNYVDSISNLYVIGRNGMHRYNNSDHSVLTALVMVDELLKPRPEKKNIWAVNVEQEYHETKNA